MRKLFAFVMAACLAVGMAIEAKAHFLFIRINEHAEAGRFAEVFFSERAEAGDPKFVGKIAQTKLWMQFEPGQFQPMTVHKATDRLRGLIASDDAVAVHGSCEYGVLSRDVSFLLRYYPKAVAGQPEKLNALKPCAETPVEIIANFADGGVTLTALQNGKPIPEAVFTTIDDNLVNEDLQADKEGRVTWKPSEAGHYSVYTKVITPKAGELDGKKYSEIREFATLAFSWPLVKPAGDPEAIAMFEKALAARASWAEFPGFSAKITGAVDGRDFTGTVNVAADGALKVTLNEETAAPWVEEQLGSLILHRIASGGRGKPVLHFADDDDAHPLGRLLMFVGGRFASSYRVKGDELTVVNRNIGPQNMTITILDNSRNAEGKILPHTYAVQYWDAVSGDLVKSETFRNTWTRVDAIDLPTENTVTTAGATGLIVRSFTLSEHLLGSTPPEK